MASTSVLYSHPLKSPFLRDTVEIQYLAEMGFLRDDYLTILPSNK